MINYFQKRNLHFVSNNCIFFLFVFITVFSVKGQTESLMDVTPSSPMAYELGKYGSDKPNLYTGAATISIPLHTIDFDGWQLPLSLSYDTSGIRANQDASEVGLGWALNATGVVTRIVKTNNDINDAINSGNNPSPGYVYENDSPQDFFYNLENYHTIGDVYGNDYLTYKYYDGEPDDFNYNFFGFSGGFVFGRDVNGTIPIIHKQKNGVKITFFEGTNGNSSFEIITPTGFKGIFSIKERSTNFGGNAPIDGPFDSSNVDLLEIQNRGNFRVVTAWYLQKIISPSGKEIFFDYNINDSQNSTYISLSQPAFGEYTGGSGTSFSRDAHEHVYLNNIQIPNEVSVSFTMEDREDVIKNFMFTSQFPVSIQKPKKYKTIQITGSHQESTFLKNIILNQSYFNQEFLYEHSSPDYNGESNKYQMLRGRLDQVQINDQVYSFEYNQGLKGLPNKSTKGIDHFGFYNGKDDNWTLWQVYRIFNTGITGTLGAIQNAQPNTDGVYEFFNIGKMQAYSQHSTRKPNIDYSIAGSLKKIVYPTGGSSLYQYDDLEYYTQGITNPTYPPSFSGFPYNNNVGAEVVSMEFSNNISINSGTVKAGGLRIKAIENRNKNNDFISKTSYIYKDINGITSGKLLTPLFFIQSSLGYANNNTYYGFHPRKSSYLPSSITAQGKRVGYSRVEEKVEDIQGNGYKTVYKFHNEALDIEQLLNTRQYFDHSDKNGKIELASSFDSSNILVKNEEQVEIDTQVDVIYSVVYENSGTMGYATYAKQLLSKVPVLQPVTKESTTTLFTNLVTNPSSGGIATSNLDTFNSEAQLISSESENSDGANYKTVKKYLVDYTNTTCVTAAEGGLCLQQVFLDKNFKNKVLEEINYKDNEVISARGYRYDLEHGNIVLKEIFVFDRASGAFNPSVNGFQFTGSYKSRITFDDYDTYGNLLQQTLKDGAPVSYIWGYNNLYPIVKGENITFSNLLTAHNASLGPNYETNIRSHPLTTNAMISTYNYNPLIGVDKISDGKGTPTNYNYNLLNRLENVTDFNQKIIREYKYNYGDIVKSGGFNLPSGLSFGIVGPGTSTTKDIPIQNTGNYDITVYSVNLPTNFTSSWSGHSFIVRPNETFNYPVTYNAPTSTTTVNINATILSNQINGGTSSVNITAQVNQNGQPNLVLPQDCFLFTMEFQTIYVTIQNTGNAPLYIYNISSNDACVSSSWESPIKKWITDSNGNPQQVYDPQASQINAGSSRTFQVQLQCPLNTNNNWDSFTDLQINTYNPSTNLINNADTVFFRRYSSDCPASPPSGPAYTLSGDSTADCTSGMSGTLNINNGSVQVVNQSNVVSGPNFVGATITISGVAILSPGQSTIITPSSYPATYNFSSNNCNCSYGFGTSRLVVSGL